jgi:predicted Zn-dependent protease
LTAEKGQYLSPYARLLLAVAALRNKDQAQARGLLTALVREFPHNKLYSEELARIQ